MVEESLHRTESALERAKEELNEQWGFLEEKGMDITITDADALTRAALRVSCLEEGSQVEPRFSRREELSFFTKCAGDYRVMSYLQGSSSLTVRQSALVATRRLPACQQAIKILQGLTT